jgi:hypothetical protein
MKKAASFLSAYAGFFLGLLFNPDDGGEMLLRTIG